MSISVAYLLAGMFGLAAHSGSAVNPKSIVVSVSPSGQMNNAWCDSPSISWTGRFIAFSSRASNLVPGDKPDTSDVFVRDRDPDGNGIFEPQNSRTILISRTTNGGPAGSSYKPAISPDGRFVTFLSSSKSLLADSTDADQDELIADLDADGNGIFRGSPKIERHSEKMAAGKRPPSSLHFTAGDVVASLVYEKEAKFLAGIDSFSSSGRFIAFASQIRMTKDAQNPTDIYLFDCRTNAVTLVSDFNGAGLQNPFVNSSGDRIIFDTANNIALATLRPTGKFKVELINGSHPSMSDDGKFVAFIGRERQNGKEQFVYRLLNRKTGNIRDFDEAPGDNELFRPSLSGDGRNIAYVDSKSGAIRIVRTMDVL